MICTYYLSIPDDHNRIVLNAIPGFDNCQGGFINACYVEVCAKTINKYNKLCTSLGILTAIKVHCNTRYCPYILSFKSKIIKAHNYCEGPKSCMLVDFWRLIWQERPSTIVMVTNIKRLNVSSIGQTVEARIMVPSRSPWWNIRCLLTMSSGHCKLL